MSTITATLPYLDKSEVNAWLRVQARRDNVLMKAHEGKATTEEIAKVFYIYSEMAVEYFTPHRHGLEPEYLDHVVLRFVDPTEQWNPEIPAQLVEWPIYDVLEHHAERSLLELSDDELARRP